MNRKTVAWTAWASTVALVLAALVLSVLNKPEPQAWLEQVLERVVFPAQSVAYATVGLLIARRRPDNSVGWLFAVVGLFAGAYAASFEYSTYAFFTDPGSLPLARWAAWVQAWVYVPSLGVSFLFVPLLFPTGHPISRRWRPVIGLAGAAVVAVTLSDALAHGRLDMFPVANPFEVPAGVASALGLAAPVLFAPATLLCVAALIVRWRRARGDERQQLKWFAFAALFLPMSALSWVAVVVFSLQGPVFDLYEGIIATLAFLGLPAATGIAILRYRLYDIDRIISRTLAYGALTALLVGGYLVAVLALQSVLPLDDDSPLIVAASTLGVVAAFGPLRARVQHSVDRRFNRARYDAERTIGEFGTRLRTEVAIESLSGDLVRVVENTMQPAHVSLWLRDSEVER